MFKQLYTKIEEQDKYEDGSYGRGYSVHFTPADQFGIGLIVADMDNLEQASFFAALAQGARNYDWGARADYIYRELVANHRKELTEIKNFVRILHESLGGESHAQGNPV